MNIKSVIGSVVVAAFFVCGVSHACVPPAFERVANEYHVRADILYSIALAESGRTTREYGFKVWPWALNINKQSFYPETKQAALKLIESVINEGNDQFDIGLMQINWHFHKTTFKTNVEYALDVGANLRAGAKILSEFFLQADDVWQAVGYYNAGASTRPASRKAARRYSDRVKRIYKKYVMGGCHEGLLADS